MKKLFTVPLLLSCLQLVAQQIVTLEYDNSDLDYRTPEKKIEGNTPDTYKFQNISIPTLQVFLPEGKTSPTTAMVVCPGGGMRHNAFFHEGLDVAQALNKKGIAAFVLKYRLVPSHLIGKNEGGTASYQNEKKQLRYGHLDALNAIAHVRENAKKYDIDPDKIGIMGFSAGGAVTIEATYKAKEHNRPNFVAPIYPWMVIVEDQDPPAYAPPLFVACTTEDRLKLAIPSAKLYIDWAEKGFLCELHLYQQGPHGFGMRKTNLPVDHWFDNMLEWIQAIGMLN